MSEQELLRTALVLPPRARRVLCVWAAVPGLVCAPFAFWQSVWAVTGVQLLRTPLLWAAGCTVLLVRSPGLQLVLPGIPAAQATALAAVLMEGNV